MQRRVVQMFLVFALILSVIAHQSAWATFARSLLGEGGPVFLYSRTLFVEAGVAQVATTLLAGLVVDRVPARRAFLWGALLTGLGWVALAFADGGWLALGLFWAIGGVGYGVVYVGGLTHLARCFPMRRGLMFGLVVAVSPLGALANGWASVSIDAAGMRWSALGFACLAAGLGALFASGIREAPAMVRVADVFGDAEPDATSARPGASGLGGWVWVALGTAMLIACSMQIATIASISRMFAGGGGAFSLGIVQVVGQGVARIGGAVVLGGLSDRLGRGMVVVGAVGLAMVLSSGLAGAPGSAGSLAAAMIAIAFASGAGPAVTAGIADHVEPGSEERRRLGLGVALAVMAQLSGAMVAGQIVAQTDFDDRLLPLLIAAAGAAATACVALGRPARRAFATGARKTTFWR